MSDKELVGVKISEESIKLEGENIVGSALVSHKGKYGFLNIKVEGGYQLLPFLDKAIDKLEEIIPGDQTMLAATLKGAIRSIKVKI